MTTDYLRNGYTALMRTMPDYPPVKVRYFRVADNTPLMPYPSVMYSRVWLDASQKPNSGVGEQYNRACCGKDTRDWANGAILNPYIPGVPCGGPDAWLGQVTLASGNYFHTDIYGVAPCCRLGPLLRPSAGEREGTNPGPLQFVNLAQVPAAGEREGTRPGPAQRLGYNQRPIAGEREGALTVQYVDLVQLAHAGEREGTGAGVVLQYLDLVQPVSSTGEREGTGAGQVRQYADLVQLVSSTGEREGTGTGAIRQYLDLVQLVSSTGEREGTGAGVVVQLASPGQVPAAGEREGTRPGPVQRLGFNQTPAAGEKEGTGAGVVVQSVGTSGPPCNTGSTATNSITLNTPSGSTGDLLLYGIAGKGGTTGPIYTISGTIWSGFNGSGSPAGTNAVSVEMWGANRPASPASSYTATDGGTVTATGALLADLPGPVVSSGRQGGPGAGQNGAMNHNFGNYANTPTVAGYALAAFAWTGGGTVSPPSGWTSLCTVSFGTNRQIQMWYKSVPANVAIVAGTWTNASCSAWAGTFEFCPS